MAKKKSAKSRSNTPDQPSFEDSLESLHGVVEQLEDGQLSLSDSLTQYELGVKHLRNCHVALKDAERKIELLVKIDKDGNLVTQDFDDSATEDPGSGSPRKRSSSNSTRNTGKRTVSDEEQELVDELEDETGSQEQDEGLSSLF